MNKIVHATCEVQSYWGEWVGYCADLKPYRTKANGRNIVRYRWVSENGSCRDIHGTFPSVEQGLIAARRAAHARDIERYEGDA